MSGMERQMFELTIIQIRDKSANSIKLYFENIEEMFIFVQSAIANARHETEYTVRVLEEGEVIE